MVTPVRRPREEKLSSTRLSADGDIAKTENHAPAGGEPAEAHLRPKTRKQEHHSSWRRTRSVSGPERIL